MAVEPGHETEAIIGFLARIGLTVRREPIARDCFLPGLTIVPGALVVDEAQLRYPGDLLHEAGHLAVMTPAERSACDGGAGADGGAEMAAIAWSYAAALEIGLDPRVVFHADGYKSGGAAILQNFTEGRYFGTPLLQYYGMTRDPQHRLPAGEAALANEAIYPKMSHWLRQAPAEA
ncbi:MAG: hypothetical protein V4555_07545 [Acidobacteriota bacterium]